MVALRVLRVVHHGGKVVILFLHHNNWEGNNNNNNDGTMTKVRKMSNRSSNGKKCVEDDNWSRLEIQ